ncbi:MAG: HAMP domain-containing sensor histidine kinase [Sulfurospirillaceae bacterium]|nr:HAMP domain-containing sensor histidine kinase [Sulfurospirillaceae bacterium]
MKSFIEHVNQKLEKIAFSSKTKILIITIFGGTLIIGFLMFISIFALKYDFEVLFQKHTAPQVKLEDIKDIYQVNIKETLSAVKNHQISNQEGIEVILLATQIIKRQWSEYKLQSQKKIGGLPEFANNWLNFFLPSNDDLKKSEFQSRIIDNIEKKIKSIDEKTGALIHFLREKHKQGILEKKIDDIILETNSISIYLSSLITNNLQRAISKKEANDRLFTTSIYMLALLIGFTFAFVILVSILIINNFKQLHYSLEENILRKTKELRLLNSSLESRIKREVENSRKRDNIMFQQARLARMGEVLQNIAHQWRQPLGALMMIVQGFQSKYQAGKLDAEFIESRVEDAQKIGKNMSDTLEDFRNFFMPNRTKQIFDVNEAIQKAIDLSKYQLQKEYIELTSKISGSIKLYGFKNELIHVILNLISNSKDSLIAQQDLKEKKILIILKQTRKNIIISVIDNGGGIKDDIISKIFDPYFTTKHKSIGTGIGLYMSKQLVEKHMNGKINCKNIIHRFGQKKFFQCAIFSVELPLKGEE